LLRFANFGERLFLDLRGLTYLALSPTELKDRGEP
jgi:hypothetical protein